MKVVESGSFYVIRSSDGLFYGKNFGWVDSIKRAKVYTQIGHAKCALTNKLSEWDSITRHASHFGQRNRFEEGVPEYYSKFDGAKIMKIGEFNMNTGSEI